jgi:hypothetical protein
LRGQMLELDRVAILEVRARRALEKFSAHECDGCCLLTRRRAPLCSLGLELFRLYRRAQELLEATTRLRSREKRYGRLRTFARIESRRRRSAGDVVDLVALELELERRRLRSRREVQ